MSIAIYTLTSALHDEEAVSKSTHEFLDILHLDFEWKGADFIDYGKSPLNIIYVRTGGTEGLFLQLFDELRQRSHHPFYFLTSGKSNSLAASMEILSFLRQKGCEGEIIHEAVVKAVRKTFPKDELIFDLADFYKIFGDTTRVKILYALDKSELCVCDISALLGMSVSAVSHQLKILRDSNLVKTKREGKVIYYSLSDDHVKSILECGMEHISELN